MRKQIGVDKDAKYFGVIDLETGERIPRCFMADDETGEYGVFATDENGKLLLDEQKEEIVREYKKGRIKLVDIRTEV